MLLHRFVDVGQPDLVGGNFLHEFRMAGGAVLVDPGDLQRVLTLQTGVLLQGFGQMLQLQRDFARLVLLQMGFHLLFQPGKPFFFQPFQPFFEPVLPGEKAFEKKQKNASRPAGSHQPARQSRPKIHVASVARGLNLPAKKKPRSGERHRRGLAPQRGRSFIPRRDV